MQKELIKTLVSIFLIINAFFLGHYFATNNFKQEIEKIKKEVYRVDLKTSKSKIEITKTELIMTGTVEQWKGFFKLRCDKAAHPQARELAIPLKEEFIKRNLINN